MTKQEQSGKRALRRAQDEHGALLGKRAKVNARMRKLARASAAPRAPSRAEQKRIHKDALRWGVFGTCVGQKKKNGRWTKELAVICLAAQKPPIRALKKSRRVPRNIVWTERRRRYRIGTDVIKVSPTLELQLGTILGPGDGVSFGADVATVGAVIDHPEFGRCLTTAGHLFAGPGDVGATANATSSGVSVPTRVMRCVRAHGIDYSLLRAAVASDCDNLFQDLIRIGPSHVPGPSDVGRQLFVLDSGSDSVETRCRGINARLQIGNDVFEDVLLCDRATRGGQSGAALVDTDNRLWGFLIGVLNGFSVFMPAETLLRLERSQLA
jgi:hypothetical protein